MGMVRWSEPLQPQPAGKNARKYSTWSAKLQVPAVPSGPENRDVSDHNRQPSIVNRQLIKFR